MLRIFGFSILLTIASIFIAGFELGLGAAVTIMVLIAIEISFSFDNAVINARVLERLSPFWQKLFLTVGILIAVVGMRFVFPIVIVMITADLSWKTVVDTALNHPEEYAKHLEEAHPSISSFGGAFLLVLSLYFFFDNARKELWLKRVERPLQRLGGTIWLPPLLASIVIFILSRFSHDHSAEILQAGLAGAIGYAAIRLLIEGLSKATGQDKETSDKAVKYTGWAAFVAFIYLEVLDASFSFDGVLGAFAITDQVLLIALGLGVGAIWVRSMTIYFVKHGTLNSYKYLEHGAHYAILFLSIALLGSLFAHIPEAVTGVTGLGIIIASYIASREAARDHKKLL